MSKTLISCLVLNFVLTAGPVLSGQDKQATSKSNSKSESKPESKPDSKPDSKPKPKKIDPVQIKQWIDGLDAERFEDRQKAVTALVKAGAPVIKDVEQAARGDSLEVSYRAIIVLRELALSLDESVSKDAEEALRRLSEPDGKAPDRAQLVQQLAGPALLTLTQQKYDRALKIIKKNGGRFTVGVYGKRLDLHKYWTGRDELLKALAQIHDLAEVYIQSSSLTDQGLKHIANAKSIQRVTIDYLPHRKVTDKGVDALRKSMDQAQILYFHGGFLGVQHEDHVVVVGGRQRRGCRIALVLKGSAAADAGLMDGDVIIGVDKNQVENSEDLLRAIAVRKPGETVEIRVLRFSGQVVLKAKLGERPSTVN